jgi:hypothetical protein
VSDQVQGRVDVEGVEERGHEAGQIAAGSVVAYGGVGFAMAGQAQREHSVGAGQCGDDPSPAGGALLVPVQQQQRRPGTGLQVLGVHPLHGDPTVVDDELALVLGGGMDG